MLKQQSNPHKVGSFAQQSKEISHIPFQLKLKLRAVEIIRLTAYTTRRKKLRKQMCDWRGLDWSALGTGASCSHLLTEIGTSGYHRVLV